MNATRRALVTAGFDSAQYAGHSYQIGVVTTAAQKGIQDSLINIGTLGECRLYFVCKNSAGGVARCGSKNGT